MCGREKVASALASRVCILLSTVKVSSDIGGLHFPNECEMFFG